METTIRINGNQIKAKDLVLRGEMFFETNNFILRGTKVNYRYESGKKTDLIDSISYFCVDPLTYNNIIFKTNTTKPIIAQDIIDKSTETIHITVPINEAVIKIYKLEYGILSLSITVPYIKIVES